MEKENKDLSLKKRKQVSNMFLEIFVEGCKFLYISSPIMLGLITFSVTKLGGFVLSLLLLAGYFFKNFDLLKKK